MSFCHSGGKRRTNKIIKIIIHFVLSEMNFFNPNEILTKKIKPSFFLDGKKSDKNEELLSKKTPNPVLNNSYSFLKIERRMRGLN